MSLSYRIILGLSLALAGAANTLAQVPATRPSNGPTVDQATHPATRPASSPTTLPARSLDSPREAVKWFATALRDGDAASLHKVIAASSDAEQRMIAGMGDMAKALAKLHAAALAAFGPEAAARFTNDTTSDFDKTLARIEAAEVLIDGDEATVRYIDHDATHQDKPFRLRKVGAVWMIPATQFSGGAAVDVLDRQVAELLVQTRIVNEIAQDVGAGKFRNADAAGLAWRSKMMSAVGGKGPGTEPTTKTGERGIK